MLGAMQTGNCELLHFRLGGVSSKEYCCPFQQCLNIDRMFMGSEEYPIHHASQPCGLV